MFSLKLSPSFRLTLLLGGFIAFLLLAALLFETVYRFEVSTLEKESRQIKQIKEATNLKSYIYRNNQILWLIAGSKAVLTNPNLITIEKFFGRNYPEHYTVKADYAQFDKKHEKILLKGNIVFEKEDIHSKVIEIVKTPSAVIDLKNNLVYGKSEVVIIQNGQRLEGWGFTYNIKTGKFTTLRVKQTVEIP